jgi:hypothetical protein
MNDRFWTRFFAFAGIFNLIVGLVLLIDPGLMGKWAALPKGDWFFAGSPARRSPPSASAI